MSNNVDFDEGAANRSNAAPYSGRHPIPTVRGYHAVQQEREAESERPTTPTSESNASPKSTKSKGRSILSSTKTLLSTGTIRPASKSGEAGNPVPYRAENRNANGSTVGNDQLEMPAPTKDREESLQAHSGQAQSSAPPEETPQPTQYQTQSNGAVERDNDLMSKQAQIGDPAPSGQSLNDVVLQSEQSQSQEIVYPERTSSRQQPQTDSSHKEQEASQNNNKVDRPQPLEDTSEVMDGAANPRDKRKQMKRMDRHETGREVTDPVTHLRTTIRDSTDRELEQVPENIPPPSTDLRSATGLSAKSKGSSEYERETDQQQLAHRGMQKLFPPPDFVAAKTEIASIYSRTLTLGLVSGLLILVFLLVAAQSWFMYQSQADRKLWLSVLVSSTILVSGLVSGGVMVYTLQGWLKNRIQSVWDDHLWAAARQQELQRSDSKTPESVEWLNSLLTSLWGLINPDLFTSLMDTVEDVMQASLPRLVRMVSVEDLGQGSESIRILGVRWLPTGAAAMSVSTDGKVKNDHDNDRKVPGEGEVSADTRDEQETEDKQHGQEEEEDQNVAGGMEGEEGDFVNVELAFSYRASTCGKKLTDKMKNAHLFLGFYLPGGIKFPVWVELRGIVGTMRLRLQLTPDPPFFSLCTLTFLGQPKVDLSCIPLTKKGLNIMDLPLISSFVQSSIDAALAQYVAPKSLTLDLKGMLVGDDFKKDTIARGILMVRIRQGRDFKEGDSSMLGLGDGSSDPYVAVGWAKFGKPVWSTRILMAEMQPVWDETAFILVTPEELNAQERLRVQLWDSDKGSADDDLGRIEVDLKELMTSPSSKGKMWDRTDGFHSLNDNEKMPGTLDWSIGYFAKTRIQSEQIQKQQLDPDIKDFAQLKEKVSKDADHKLREATDRNQSKESDQQKAQDLKEKEDAMIISAPPLHNYPSGVFSIQIHNITGIEYEQISKNQDNDDGEEGGDLPSAYCTVILNHQKIFMTRTKPKNAKPFFNAGCERFIKDWRSTEVVVSVRDSRVHENDALLGTICLRLGEIFKHRAQVMESFPLVGGIGHGRARISMLFRSLQVQLPTQLLGWEYGTAEIAEPITSSDVSSDLSGLKLKLRTSINRGKMFPSRTIDGKGGHRWAGKRDAPVHLAVRKRYCSCIIFEFKKNNIGVDKPVAFGVLWLKDIPDEHEVTVDVLLWRMDKDKFKRGTTNMVQEDLGEKLGTLHVPLVFRRGLGAYHGKLVSKNPNLQDVYEVLRTADENKEVSLAMKSDDHSGTSSDSDSSDSDSDYYVNDGKGGPAERIKHYKEHSDQLHRRQRGVMQWKGARTADYLKTKVEHGKEHFLDKFKHHEREPGIETEV